jgi:hypothetical protein
MQGLLDMWKKFVASEYPENQDVPFQLFATDSGGFDTTADFTASIQGDEIVFRRRLDDDSVESQRFRLERV